MSTHGYAPWIFDATTRALRRRRAIPRGPNVFFLLPTHIEHLRQLKIGLTIDELPNA
jgi:hypothetical protein